ncbi:hypothetical protein K402DRAFT_391843 [Aulographum hederae CBS 113979]|uniref:RING-type domain-containing protein n=1 Tax=Aulographum hederae CBS 113979 TaxID=1176131 RepID=A0A6G1H6C9_9PEZI|nr:hypothetical protein K402DRAFT_391843 [Aulographum hederae CBS 113979]
MSADNLAVVALDFPNPEYHSLRQDDFVEIPSNFSFALLNSNIRTLSTTAAPGSSSDITGFLYVPEPRSCNASHSYVPQNVTRKASIPSTFHLIAFAPWINSICTLSYLEAVQTDPLRAFIFYLPDNNTETPPLPNDIAWGLGDGGSWKTNNHFPVYAVPGAIGAEIMNQLSLYSGNVTSVPNGHDLANFGVSPSDYIRLAADIDLGSKSTVPSLWIFLLVVLAILLVIIGVSSFVMHAIQRRRRRRLARRIANGEVDIEALGIKRLTVPQELLDKMPMYTYTASSEQTTADDTLHEKEIPIVNSVPRRNSDPTKPSVPLVSEASAINPPPTVLSEVTEATNLTTSTQHSPPSFNQPTCAICLDDFIVNETIIRELPCRHVFHPDCVDSFLRDNSSLCPLCKKTTLPRGYCPTNITNAMVRREAMIRRRGERLVGHGNYAATQNPVPRLRSAVLGGRRVFSAPARTDSAAAGMDVEMQPGPNSSVPAPQPSHIPLLSRIPGTGPHAAVNTPVRSVTSPDMTRGSVSGIQSHPGFGVIAPPPHHQSRREWARQRALAMLGPRHQHDDDLDDVQTSITAGEARRPMWKRVVGKVFPGPF